MEEGQSHGSQMILPEAEGGYGCIGFSHSCQSCPCQEGCQVLKDWIKLRYTKYQGCIPLLDPDIPSLWLYHVEAAPRKYWQLFGMCGELQAHMERRQCTATLKSISEVIRVKSHTNDLASGIWSHLSKFSIMLWRIRWGFINTFKKMRQWKMQTVRYINSARFVVRKMKPLSVEIEKV